MAIKPYLFSFWMVGITAKRTAIHRTRRRQEGEVLALPIAGRGDVARSASPQDRRPTKQAERSGHSNPVQLMPPRFEHEHEDDLVAVLGVRLRRAQSSRSIALRLCDESPSPICGKSVAGRKIFVLLRSRGFATNTSRHPPSRRWTTTLRQDRRNPVSPSDLCSELG